MIKNRQKKLTPLVGGHFLKGAYILDQNLSVLFNSSQILTCAKLTIPGFQLPFSKYSVVAVIDNGCRKVINGTTDPLSLTTSSSACIIVKFEKSKYFLRDFFAVGQSCHSSSIIKR